MAGVTGLNNAYTLRYSTPSYLPVRLKEVGTIHVWNQGGDAKVCSKLSEMWASFWSVSASSGRITGMCNKVYKHVRS